MTRTNLWFSEELLARLKLAKAKTGMPVVELIRRAIEKYLIDLDL